MPGMTGAGVCEGRSPGVSLTSKNNDQKQKRSHINNMLIKIASTLLVISIALFIITRVYFNTLSAGNKLRLTCTTNYKTGEKILFMIIGFTYMLTFVIVIIAVISLIFRYL